MVAVNGTQAHEIVMIINEVTGQIYNAAKTLLTSVTTLLTLGIVMGKATGSVDPGTGIRSTIHALTNMSMLIVIAN